MLFILLLNHSVSIILSKSARLIPFMKTPSSRGTDTKMKMLSYLPTHKGYQGHLLHGSHTRLTSLPLFIPHIPPSQLVLLVGENFTLGWEHVFTCTAICFRRTTQRDCGAVFHMPITQDKEENDSCGMFCKMLIQCTKYISHTKHKGKNRCL